MYRKKNSKSNLFANANVQVNTLNTPYLIIVESPSKCGKIESYLGFQYKCISSKGHIRELKKVKTKKDNYEPIYEIIEGKKSHVEFMQKIIQQFEPQNIILATDDDREGEGIAWHICEVFRLNTQTTKRIIFHEITRNALQDAVKNPMTIRMNIVIAQQTRQILDRIIGFKISPFLSRIVTHDSNDYLSAGRCQTPALRLVYENDMKANEENLKLEYEVFGTFLPHPSTLKFKLHKNISNETACKEFLEKTKTFQHKLVIKSTTSKTKSAPKPFNTSQLLQTAGNTVHSTPKQTMMYAQELYQEGHITYMRTDSIKYSKTFITTAENYIQSSYGMSYIGNSSLLENKNANDPHEAIRVTDIKTTHIEGDNKKKALYKLIWSRTVESCMSPYEFNSTVINISAPLENKYVHEIEVGIFLGWKRVKTTEQEFAKDQLEKSALCGYVNNIKGKYVNFQKIECHVNNVNSPKHYTEPGLIQKLEELGIGRPSTFSMLVNTIQEREYVHRKDLEGETHTCIDFSMDKSKEIIQKETNKTFGSEKNKLIIEDLGKQVIQLLLQHFAVLFSYEYTKQMEDELDKLINNTDNQIDLIYQCETTIKECMKPLQVKIKQVYDITEETQLVFGKNGAYIKYKNSEKTKSLKQNIELDFAKLENNEYSLDDLIDINDGSIGIYENEPMFLKRGQYGPYVQWGNNTKSLRSICPKNKSIHNISFEEICSVLEISKNSNVLRSINTFTNIQSGRYGPFVYHKTPYMKKPQFISLKKFPQNFMGCEESLILEWLKEKHEITS